jgi:hypothetical protein
VYATTLFLNNIISRVLFSGGSPRMMQSPFLTHKCTKEHAYEQTSLSQPPPPQQGCRRCALLSSISLFIIVFIVIVIIVIIAIIASRGLLSAGTQHITRACVEGHPNYFHAKKHPMVQYDFQYESFSPPPRPLQGRCCYILSLISD